ncbi:sulfur carrier protein ThiS [Paenibacillus sp. HB172176]|uniref:sulfur carrier protein ThiS n=1 Tax=Paenibacillus sp. HB172176 TaxID=2493690 RepID=UPI00143B4861|nr:sulfur carrier protein ThiS [Paenibacillus sp. HB172176]
MQLMINGKRESLDVRTVEDIVSYYELLDKPIVVEADGHVLTKEQWSSVNVNENSKIELVHFVGGG